MVEAARVAEWDEDLAQLLAEARAERAAVVRPRAARQPVRHLGRPAARRSRGLRPRARPADAAPAGAGRPLRYGVPRLGRAPVRPAGPHRAPTSCPVAPTPTSMTRPTSARWSSGSRTAPSVTAPPTPSRHPSRSCSPARSSAAASTRSTPSLPESGGGFLVVDWKTSRHETSDPLQLALYRLAWSELTGTPLDQVRAAFHYVRSGRTVMVDDLPRPRGPRAAPRPLRSSPSGA